MKSIIPALLACAGLLLLACGGENPVSNQTHARDSGTEDAAADLPPAEDVAPPDTTVEDTSDDDVADVGRPDVGSRPGRGATVALDLAPLIIDAPDPDDEARVFQSSREEDLVGGPAAQGRVGDYVLENGLVRLVIEGDARAIGPCPYGGNVIDGDVRRPDGEPGQDVVGEICLFLFMGQTLKPDRYEIVSDGSDGSAAVLAVTGHLELLDFINVTGLASSFLSGLTLNLVIDTDGDKDMTITVYYILRPGDRGVRVVTAMRNDGNDALHVPFLHVIDSGGDVDFFNPTGTHGGFGYGNLDAASIGGEHMIFLGFRGEHASHTYVAEPFEGAPGDLPLGGAYLAVSGVAVPMLGTTRLLDTLIANQNDLETLEWFDHLQPGGVATRTHWHLIGDGSMATTVDVALHIMGLDTGHVSGAVETPSGTAVAGAMVAAIDAEGRTLNHARTGADGVFAMALPGGDYVLRAHAEGRATLAAQDVTVTDGDEVDVTLTVSEQGSLTVHLRDADGAVTPGKVTVSCVGGCPIALDNNDRDVKIDALPGNVAHIEFVGVDGEAQIPLAPGDYTVVVTRGFEWSMWPPHANVAGGAPVTIESDSTVELDAEIARVVESRGVLSGDMHVHSINSPDSRVALDDRVESYLAEGVEVLVSTDHDRITDYAPTIERLGASKEIVSVVGEEITTFDYGHYNAFPLREVREARNGGAIDWAGGPESGLSPAEIFARAKAFPGEQVVQVNHGSGGMFAALGADPLAGTSSTDPTVLRIAGGEPDPITGDTGLWTDEFTALEVMNGNSRGSFWALTKWWMVFLGRGFRPAGTAVSDTHKRFKTQAGGPQSYIFVGDGADVLGSFDSSAFAKAINQGRLVGSNGPFMAVEAENAEGAVAGLGDVLTATAGEPLTVRILIDVPEWMKVNTVSLFANITEGVVPSRAGAFDETPLPATASASFTLEESDLVIAAQGVEVHRHYVKTVELTYTPSADTYLIVMLDAVGQDIPTMFPASHSGGLRPFAFSNPIYLDTDGGGYDHPPLLQAAKSRSMAPAPTKVARPVTTDDVRQIADKLGDRR